MGEIQEKHPVKLIVGLIAKDEALFYKVEKRLIERFGPVDFKSNVFNFNFTDYYKNELGSNLKRLFLSFKELIDPGLISRIKICTNNIERNLSTSGKRRINIDPGYLDLAKLVLATTKDFSHRIYLGKGIYAELTLIFKNGDFKPLEWTYPDYQTKEYLEAFNKIRELYHQQIK